MIAVTRSKVKPGQMFKIIDEGLDQHDTCVTLDKEQVASLLRPAPGRMVREGFYHVHIDDGRISWMWDREVWVDGPESCIPDVPITTDDQARATMLKDTCTTLGICTLETRNSDRLDFHELAVWSIKAVVEAAYEAGLAQVSNKTLPAGRKQ